MDEVESQRGGVGTSEFWLAVLVVVAATVLRITHDVDPDAWKWAVSSASVGYAGSRALVKKAAVAGEARVASFKSDLSALAAQTAEEAAASRPRRPKP